MDELPPPPPSERVDLVIAYSFVAEGLVSTRDGDHRAVAVTPSEIGVGYRVTDHARVEVQLGMGLFELYAGGGATWAPRGFRASGPTVGLHLTATAMGASCPLPQAECRTGRDSPPYFVQGAVARIPIAWRGTVGKQHGTGLSVGVQPEIGVLDYRPSDDAPTRPAVWAGGVLGGIFAVDF